MRLVIASRKSDLARLQSYMVAQELKNKFPHLEIEHHFSQSFGDQNPDAPLWAMPEKGVFTEDFREGLANGQFDMVVHSWKDLPSDLMSSSQLHTLKRADARDVLLIRKESLDKIKEKGEISIFTSSPRRSYHMELSLNKLIPGELKNINFEMIRGNIPTRLEKLVNGQTDSLIVAKAALDRLFGAEQSEFQEVQQKMRGCLQQCHWMVLPHSHFPTAAAQGALAIETLKDNKTVNDLLSQIHDEDTYQNVVQEREILRSYGGGCHQKIGINFSKYEFGTVKSLIGLSTDNVKLKDYSLLAEGERRGISSEKFWPSQNDKENFFDYEFFDVQIPHSPLWVSHYRALPEGHQQSKDQIIWCAGISTWQKLASKGYWVNGCSDSLGENIEQQLQYLNGDQINFVKLTHESGKKQTQEKTIATYNVIKNENKPNFENIDDFFWSSSSSFLKALETNPDIINKNHACGPGHTFALLKEYIPLDNIKVVLSYEHWLTQLQHKNGEATNEND